MNAIDKPASVQDAGPGRAADLPSFAAAGRWVRVLGWLMAGGFAAAIGLAVALGLPHRSSALAMIGQTRLLPVLLSALLLPCTGFLASWMIGRTRRDALLPPLPRRRWLPRPRRGDESVVGTAARWPQAVAVTVLGSATLLAAWQPPLAPIAVASTVSGSQLGLFAGAAALVLTFPLLLAERWFAAEPAARLPEAPLLRLLLLIPVLAWPLAGLAEIAASSGVPAALWVPPVLLVVISVVAVELILRALGRCFLPPPPPATARAAIDSLAARFIADGLRTRSLAAPVRTHLGIDFSRSWALSYLRAATPPVALALLVLSWGLSGIVMLGVDQRAIYERFGRPVAVLHPGAHLILPWPMGQGRRLEYGPIHETTLADASIAVAGPTRVGAEAPPPADADRLWDQVHPSELDFLIASSANGQQSFQVVSADIKLRYRIGLSDADALHAVYGTADPLAVLRATASRTVAQFFADQTLDAVLGEDQNAIAARLQATLQPQLDRVGSGIELAAVVIEAIHPPAGAAEAYHEVQAAEIRARTAIAAERGRALSTQSNAQQYAQTLTDQSHAAAAEAASVAHADTIRFDADLAAARANWDAFILERRLAALSQAMAKAPLTVLDHRIPAGDAPVLDLRPFSPAAARTTPAEQE